MARGRVGLQLCSLEPSTGPFIISFPGARSYYVSRIQPSSAPFDALCIRLGTLPDGMILSYQRTARSAHPSLFDPLPRSSHPIQYRKLSLSHSRCTQPLETRGLCCRSGMAQNPNFCSGYFPLCVDTRLGRSDSGLSHGTRR